MALLMEYLGIDEEKQVHVPNADRSSFIVTGLRMGSNSFTLSPSGRIPDTDIEYSSHLTSGLPNSILLRDI